MSFLTSILGLGDKKTSSSNQTSQNDNRQVNDASGGGVVGSHITFNILGDEVARLFNAGSSLPSPFASITDANGMRNDGIAGQAAGALSSPVVLLAVAGLVAVVILKR